MLVLCLASACMPGVPPPTKAADDSLAVEIRQQGSPNPAATTLKWSLVFPAQLMDLQGEMEAAGADAKMTALSDAEATVTIH